MGNPDDEENEARMQRGELYYAFVPTLIAKRKRCHNACRRFNQAEDPSRRKLVELWRECDSIIDDGSPLPPPAASDGEDAVLLQDEPYIDGPIKIDYGTNLRIGKGVNINYDCTFIDTCLITIGARTLVGPNCSFFSGTHPLDPFLRSGTRGPELGAPITIGEDCWFGGGVIVCPGVTIGRGVTVGAGSVVTKDVPDFHVVAGNPARILRKITPTESDPSRAEDDK
ncbi:probable acetyltransferase, CysE/LacA/LpxA/NodL family [Phialocephala subalpina]|uniref:Probable acetyltransferase, CysE/LacA/LpxA/NodL family n=1 Tax=Phialocephala subalpina TaxID=576137 RepID=A0A1L7XXQ6_9HELO|nr:probable acetyltransferase, CysE/LacA/LpxA/NodL family [Phialocephala subalpina]